MITLGDLSLADWLHLTTSVITLIVSLACICLEVVRLWRRD